MRAIEEIRRVRDEFGVEGLVDCISATLEGRKLPNGATVPLKKEQDYSFQSLWEGLVGPMDWIKSPPQHLLESGLDPTGFPSATEKLLSSIMIKGYETQNMIADRLVTEEYRPKTLTERIVGFTADEMPFPIATGEEYPTVGFGEKWANFEEIVHNKKEGMEIRVTEEVIRFDQTAMVLRKAQGIGMRLAQQRERRTVRACLGIGADTGTAQGGVYYPSGVNTPLYSAAQLNLRTNTTPIYNFPGKTADSKLEDYTDFQEVMAVHATNIKDDPQNSDGQPIGWNPNVILVPVTMSVIAANIFAAQGVTWMANIGSTSAPEIRAHGPNPLSYVFGTGLPNVLTSPYVDEISTTQWAVFDNMRTFVRIIVFPFETFRAPMGYGWNRDMVFAMRAREWSRVACVDYRHAVLNTGAA